MDRNTVSFVFAGIALVLVFLFLALTIKHGTKKYKVTLANNEVRHLTRTWYDGYNDIKDMRTFREENKKKIAIASHWIISIEEE